MPPTTTSTATITRDSLVKRAYRQCGVDYPSVSRVQQGVDLLNDIMKELDSEGRWLTAIEPVPSTFTTVSGQRAYAVGGSFQYAKLSNTSPASIDLSNALNPDHDEEWSAAFWANTPTNGSIELSNVAGDLGLSILLDSYAAQYIVYFGNSSLGNIRISFDAALENTGWKHIAITYDGSGVAAGFAVYVDGAAVATTVLLDTLAGDTTVSPNNFTIQAGIGSIDDFGIYNAALSSDEIAEIYAARQNSDLSLLSSAYALASFFPFDGDSEDHVGGTIGVDTDILYPTGTLNGIDPNILRLERVELVQGTSRVPFRIVYTEDALNTILRESTGGQPCVAWLQKAALQVNQKMHLFPTPDAVYQIAYTFQRRLYDFLLATDNPDVPADWNQRLVKRLAAELAPELGLPLEEQQLKKGRSDEAMHDGKSANAEQPSPFPRRSQFF